MLGHFLIQYTKLNTKRIKDLKVRTKTTRILEVNTVSTLFDISHSNILLDMSPQARETKTKIHQWDYIRLKGFCTGKETISKMKTLLTEWEKIFSNDISDKELLSKIY